MLCSETNDDTPWYECFFVHWILIWALYKEIFTFHISPAPPHPPPHFLSSFLDGTWVTLMMNVLY